MSKVWVLLAACIVLAASISSSAQTTTLPTVKPKPAAKAKAVKGQPAAAAAPLAAEPATAQPSTVATAPAAVPATGSSAAPTTQGAAPAADRGTLSWGTRVYNPVSCAHNGTHAACTFTFVNQGNGATLRAGNGGEMAGISLVDDAHVPHKWDGAYFVDKYGSQQPTLFVEKGDSGTYLINFPNVDPRVVSAEFHLRNQVVGGVSVTPPPSAPSQTTPAKTGQPAAK